MVEVPFLWFGAVVTLLNEMAGEGIAMQDCADPADLMSDIAEHLGCGEADDPWEAIMRRMSDEPKPESDKFRQAAALLSEAAQTISSLELQLEAARTGHEMQQRNTEKFHTEVRELRSVLRHIVVCYEARSKLYITGDLAATLAEIANKAL